MTPCRFVKKLRKTIISKLKRVFDNFGVSLPNFVLHNRTEKCEQKFRISAQFVKALL